VRYVDSIDPCPQSDWQTITILRVAEKRRLCDGEVLSACLPVSPDNVPYQSHPAVSVDQYGERCRSSRPIFARESFLASALAEQQLTSLVHTPRGSLTQVRPRRRAVLSKAPHRLTIRDAVLVAQRSADLRNEPPSMMRVFRGAASHPTLERLRAFGRTYQD
jgi:hypothetical protein